MATVLNFTVDEAVDYLFDRSKEFPLAMIMVGLPGSGKSTFLETLQNQIFFTVCSTDHFIERAAQELGITYEEAFRSGDKDLNQKACEAKYVSAIKQSHNVVVDQTNVGAEKRVAWMAMLSYLESLEVKKPYLRAAVVFDVPLVELFKRTENRAALDGSSPGKHIPRHVIKGMYDRFVKPGHEEGFHVIINVLQD